MMLMYCMSMFSMFILFMMISIFFIISKKTFHDREKITSFECGFDPFNQMRLPMSIQFFLITLIFLIFDIEFTLLIPLIPSLNMLTPTSWMSCSIIVMLILIFGLIIEFNDSSLEWIY